jgi:predicted nucleotidyltransferase
MPRTRQGRILKIVLVGSYARGDCVNDLDGGYVSDYDLLVVVNHEKLTEVLEYWAKAEDHLTREYAIAHRLTAPVNFIVHTLTEVNKKLKKGRPFFVDVASDEIVLHEAPDSTFERPELLPPTEAFQEALGDLEYWLPMSAHAMQLAEARAVSTQSGSYPAAAK